MVAKWYDLRKKDESSKRRCGQEQWDILFLSKPNGSRWKFKNRKTTIFLKFSSPYWKFPVKRSNNLPIFDTAQPASLPGIAQYVLDGGALLQRIPWQHGSTFGAILDTYVDFVLQNYAQGIIIFDGYDSFSTKDMTHKYQSKGKKSVSVAFTPEMKLTVTKDVFFSNPSNK